MSDFRYIRDVFIRQSIFLGIIYLFSFCGFSNEYISFSCNKMYDGINEAILMAKNTNSTCTIVPGLAQL